jgi:ATP-dependent DNA helicase RecG
VSVLASVSERKAGRLAELGVESVLDLLTTYPRRYIDRTRQADVSDLQVGDEAAVLAAVQSAQARRARTGRAVVDVVVRDETGRLKIVFFNQPWRAKQLEPGT